MEITVTNLQTIQDGSYYLSNRTGEITKAGIWQWIKCATGLGDGRDKVRRLAEAVKAALLADAEVQSDDALTGDIDALDKTKSISSEDLKRIATRFRASHASAIAKSDAHRAAEGVADEAVEEWARNRTIYPSDDSKSYLRKLVLYAARPIVERVEKYGGNVDKAMRDVKTRMGLAHQFLGTVELYAPTLGLRYPASQYYKAPGQGKPKLLSAHRFILDELHFRAILACMFQPDGKLNLPDLCERLSKFKESRLQELREQILAIPLDDPKISGAHERFAKAFRELA